MEQSREMESIRIFGRVADRKEQCEVNPNFNHWCRTHRQATCANHKPLHCSVAGDLVMAKNDISLHDGPNTVHLVSGKKYCMECGCASNGICLIPPFFVREITVVKRNKKEMIDLEKQESKNPSLIAEINNFYK